MDTPVSRSQSARAVSPVLPYAWVILWAMYFASIAGAFNQFKAPPILPLMMQDFQLDLSQAGALMSTIAIAGLVLALPAGIFLEKIGPKVLMLLAMGCIAIGAAAGAVSGSYSILLASRVLEGVGIGLIGVAAPATISMWFPPDRQGGPIGIWATWVPVGTVAVYALAPYLAGRSNGGWQPVWWVGAAYAGAMMVVSGLLLRRPPQERNAPIPNGLPAAEAALPAEAHSRGGQKKNPRPDPEARAPGLLAALANRQIWLLALMFNFFTMGFVSLSTYYPTFLTQERGFPLNSASLVASIATFVVLVSAPAAGWISDRIHSRRLVFSIPFLLLVVEVLLIFQVDDWQIPALLVAQGLLVGAIPTAAFTAAPEIMGRPQWAGLGLAVLSIGANLGQLIGPPLFGMIVGRFGWEATGYALALVCLAGFASGWAVKVR